MSIDTHRTGWWRTVRRGGTTRGTAGPRDRSWFLPRVRLHPVLIEVAAVTVVDDDGRKGLDFKTTDSLSTQIFVGDYRKLLHELREHRAGAADGAEVDTLVLAERVLHRLPAVALSDRPLEPELEKRGRELVHPARRRRTDRAHDVARARRRRPRVIDDLAAQVEWELLALLDQREEPAVRGVARRIEDARDPHAIARLQRLDVGVAERRPHLLDPVGPRRDAHSVTSLCRCAWHSISSEGGCAPLPNLPRPTAPAKPALEQRRITASLPCADARGIRSSRPPGAT